MGQDTLGRLFIVSVIVVEKERDNLLDFVSYVKGKVERRGQMEKSRLYGNIGIFTLYI